MPIDEATIIDLIGTDKGTGNVVLTISDPLDWNDIKKHLQLLQEKINNYLMYIESGEIYVSYPNAKGRKFIIEIIGEYQLSAEGETFIAKANPIIKDLGVEIVFSLYKKEKEGELRS
jgi:hypothetical protein